MYNTTQSGLAAENYIFMEHDQGNGSVNDMSVRGMEKYLLRPETVESLYVLYEKTKNPVFR